MAARTACLAPSTTKTVLRACRRWKALWDAVTAREGDDKMARRGSMAYAPQLWWLVVMHTKVAGSGDLTSPHMRTAATDSMDHMNRFLNQYKNL